jgi:hypothetical protein
MKQSIRYVLIMIVVRLQAADCGQTINGSTAGWEQASF